MNAILEAKIKTLPDKPGCYLMRDRRGTIIYVGKAISLKRRVSHYFQPATLHSAPPKVRSMIHCIEDFDFMVVRNEAEALLTESNLIKQYKPRFNILMRDDKRYLALRADANDAIPRITTCRIIRPDAAEYFGPFPSGTIVRTVLDFTEKRYGLRKCTALCPDAETHTHCHDDVLRFCSAPCIGRISPEAYRARFDAACAFLRGEDLTVIEEIKTQMLAAAQTKNYEHAARLRDTWIALREMVKQKFTTRKTPEIHKADARFGIQELQNAIGLENVPDYIECFDISNLFGTHAVASMVVALDGMPDKRMYRHFRIKTVEGADDPRSMAEVVERRYTRLREEKQRMPTLLVCDGGITQLRATRAILQRIGIHIPTVGLAKQMEEIVIDPETLDYPLTVEHHAPSIFLPHDSEALMVLTRLRDEAHRFAITYHRHIREKTIRESALDEIPGIGPAKKIALLRRFGSVARLSRATPDDIAATPGITDALACAIAGRLQKSNGKNPHD